MNGSFDNITFDYSGYKVLVTGGSHGIGTGIAAAYRMAGAEVTITGTRASAGDYDTDLGDYRYLQMVATDKDSIGAVAEALPALDILVNNAGAALPGGRDEYDPDVFDEALAINLSSNYRLAAALHDKLVASTLSGGASIVGIGSLTGLFGVEMTPGYGSAKTGLMGLTRVLAVRYARDNIRVNALACGLIKSNMTGAMLEVPEMIQPILARTPMKRVGEPADIAGPVLFLTSPAARFITGQTLAVDGGYSVQG